MPECWDVSISRVVLRWPSDMFEKDGRASARVVCHVRFPTASWIMRASRVAVMALVLEPRWNWSVMRTGVGSPCLRTPVTCDLKGLSRILLPTARAGKLFSPLYFSRVSRDFFSAETELFACQIAHDEGGMSQYFRVRPTPTPTPTAIHIAEMSSRIQAQNRWGRWPRIFFSVVDAWAWFLYSGIGLDSMVGCETVSPFLGWSSSYEGLYDWFCAVGARSMTGRSIEIQTLLGAGDEVRQEEGEGVVKMMERRPTIQWTCRSSGRGCGGRWCDCVIDGCHASLACRAVLFPVFFFFCCSGWGSCMYVRMYIQYINQCLMSNHCKFEILFRENNRFHWTTSCS